MTSVAVVFGVALILLATVIFGLVKCDRKHKAWDKYGNRSYDSRKETDKGPSRWSSDTWDQIGIGCGVICFLCVLTLVIFSIVYPIVRMSSTSRVAELEAFHDSTVRSFEIAAEETETVTIFVSDQALIDAGYWEQGLAVSDRLAELRDKISWYNENLNRNRHWNDIWFTNGFTADATDRLTYIEMEYNPDADE